MFKSDGLCTAVKLYRCTRSLLMINRTKFSGPSFNCNCAQLSHAVFTKILTHQEKRHNTCLAVWMMDRRWITVYCIYGNHSLFFCYVYRDGGQFIGNRYGAGSGRIWLDDVRCDGTETDIRNCRHSDWGVHKCTHSDDVSVSCIAGDYHKQFASSSSASSS